MCDLVPHPGIEPGPPTLGTEILSYKTTRESHSAFLTLSMLEKLKGEIYEQQLLYNIGSVMIELFLKTKRKHTKEERFLRGDHS